MGGIVIVDSVSGGTTDGANKDLSNLTVTGEARFTAKAGVDLDNISSAGVSVITSYATGGGANTDLSNLSVTGQAVIDGKANTDLDNLSVTGEAKFKAPALISSDADNGLTSGTDDKLYIDVNVSGKANTDLDNITTAGTSVITSLIASNITGKANTDLDNLSVTGQAVIDGKANVSLNNLTSAGTSVITSLVASGITGKANTDLDNLSVTGEAKFTAKAGVDLDNISSAGVSVITSYATGGGANTDLSNLSVTGQAVIDGKANTDLSNLSEMGAKRFIYYTTSSTSGETANKTASLTGFTLSTGVAVDVVFTNTNTSNTPTLNINSTGDKPIAHENGNVVSATSPAYFPAGSMIRFIYDGTNWRFKNVIVESYFSGSNWYRLFADGFIEQGGGTTGSGTTTTTVTFIKPFTQVSSIIAHRTPVSSYAGAINNASFWIPIASVSTTTLVYKSDYTAASLQMWSARGY